ncbi:MAG: ion channel [Pseudomonadota bacterium]
MIGLLRILMRRRRFRSLALTGDEMRRQLLISSSFVITLFVLHTIAMMSFEALSPGNALWLTLTTATTVGYGDISAATTGGRISTVLLIYFGGIFILAKTAGDWFDYRANARLRKKCGNWNWNMNGHTLIINTPSEDGERFFLRAIEQLRASSEYREKLVLILTRRFPGGLPDTLSRMSGLTHHNGDACDPGELRAVDADQASAIVILAREETNPDSDSRTFDILHRLKEIGVDDALVLAECVDDHNRERFRAAGADIVIRPVRAYPEMLVRGLVAPGAEQIIENMFTASSDEYVRYDVSVDAKPWHAVACRLMQDDLGTAVGYIDTETGRLETNPRAHTTIRASALFVIANEEAKASLDQVRDAVAAC